MGHKSHVVFLGFLDFLDVLFLFFLVLFDELLCGFELLVDESDTLFESSSRLFHALIDQNSSYLLVQFGGWIIKKGTFLESFDLFKDESVLTLLLVESGSGVFILLSFLLDLVEFFDLLFDFVLKPDYLLLDL